jgi:hypothetical protein
MGAKNHAVVMSDGTPFLECLIVYWYLMVPANKNLALNSIVGAAFGGEYPSVQGSKV